jgi:hypothetical protein
LSENILFVQTLETGKGVIYTSVLFRLGPNTAFLVPDICKETDRNDISISADVTDDTIEND